MHDRDTANLDLRIGSQPRCNTFRLRVSVVGALAKRDAGPEPDASLLAVVGALAKRDAPAARPAGSG